MLSFFEMFRFALGELTALYALANAGLLSSPVIAIAMSLFFMEFIASSSPLGLPEWRFFPGF